MSVYMLNATHMELHAIMVVSQSVSC